VTTDVDFNKSNLFLVLGGILLSDMTVMISDAEWEIMRIIWARAPVTSNTVTKELSEITGWMPTTVKTLLSRLVKKEILRVEVKGRTFYYEPTVSEEACIKSEMRSLLQKVYGGMLNLETDHFIFKGHQDKAFNDVLSKELESNYTKITAELGITLSEKILVYTHSTQKRLHSALGLLQGPQWLRAGYIWDILHIAPKECFTDLAPEKAAVHTFILLLIHRINPMIPYWLSQAVATYESGWITKESVTIAVRKYKTQADLVQMKDFTDAFLSFKESGGYELSYTVAEFIVTHYDSARLAKFVRQPSEYYTVFGCTESQFWLSWQDFLEVNYIRE